MKIFKKIITILMYTLTFLSFLLIIVLTVSFKKSDTPSIFGYSALIVVSDSMTGAIEVNDFILIKNNNNYQEGDIITFYYEINKQRVRITHRIIEVDKENKKYITCGDKAYKDPNKNYLDYCEEVSFDDVLGKVVYISSFLGSFLTLKIFQNKSIIFLLIIIILIYYIVYLSKLIFKDYKQQKNKETNTKS